MAFLQLPANPVGLAISSLPALVLLVAVWRWLTPHVGKAMQIPVTLYILVITAMLLCAGLTASQPAALLIIGGAWGFACSYLAVARRQFIQPTSRLHGVWGTPLYFLFPDGIGLLGGPGVNQRYSASVVLCTISRHCCRVISENNTPCWWKRVPACSRLDREHTQAFDTAQGHLECLLR